MTIAKHTSDFVGEVAKLYLIPSSYFETYPETDSDFEVDFTEFSIKSGKNFENIYFSPQSCNFQESQSIENAGEIFNKDISFRIPKNRSDVSMWMHLNKNRRWTAMVMTADGSWYLVTKELLLKYKRVWPDTSDKFNGWEVSITGKDKTASPIVTGVTL